jgi:hypothetical protein
MAFQLQALARIHFVLRMESQNKSPTCAGGSLPRRFLKPGSNMRSALDARTVLCFHYRASQAGRQ